MATQLPTRRNSALLLVLLFAQLLLMAGSSRGKDGSTVLQAMALRLTAPVRWVASGVGGAARGAVTRVHETFVAKRENAHLRDRVRQLRESETLLRETAGRARELERLLQMRESLAPRAIGASIVSANLDRHSRMIVIDRGADAGVQVDAGVVAWGGALGRVVYVDGRYAKVRLLSDPNSGAAGVIERSGAGGMVIGNGEEILELVYVSRFDEVAIGDRVVTSGLDGIFPAGFSIGRVTFVGDADEVSRSIRITPSVDVQRVEQVLVLLEPAGGGLLPPLEREADR